MRLAGKTAFITGGTSGIGFATAKLLTSEGARVAVTGRDQSKFESVKARLGGTGLVINADARSVEEMRAASAQVEEAFGGLDIFFANAGKAGGGALADTDENAFDDIMDLNVKGVFFSMQAVAPIMRNGGSVILNTSFLIHKGTARLAVLAASKSAIRSFARSWSREFLDRNIRVNTVSPGYTDTPLHSKMGGTAEEIENRKAAFAKIVPVGRIGQPEDIAHAVLFLAGEESRYIIGTELVVDGGMSEL